MDRQSEVGKLFLRSTWVCSKTVLVIFEGRARYDAVLAQPLGFAPWRFTSNTTPHIPRRPDVMAIAGFRNGRA